MHCLTAQAAEIANCDRGQAEVLCLLAEAGAVDHEVQEQIVMQAVGVEGMRLLREGVAARREARQQGAQKTVDM